MRLPKNVRLSVQPAALLLTCGLLAGAAACGGDVEKVYIVCDGGVLGSEADAGVKDSGTDAGRDAATDAGSDAGDAAVSDAAVSDAAVLNVPFPTSGMRIEAANGAWTFVTFPDTQCRDGSNAGIAVNLNNGSKKLMIVLEGGGACFDAASCRANAASIGSQQRQLGQGVFDRGNLANPVRDWNFVYVPYCTGDIHGGTNYNGMIDGVQGLQRFVGYLNMQRFMQRVVPTFKDATDVVLAGVSAGGYGVQMNGIMVQRAFGNQVKVRLVNDSGPPLSSAVAPECLQEKWRSNWGFNLSLFQDCATGACSKQNDYQQAYALYLAQVFADRPIGLVSSSKDAVISSFLGGGRNNCTGITLQDSLSATEFQTDLLAFREKARAFANYGTFLIDSTSHGWIYKPEFYTQQVGEVKLVDWFGRIVNGQTPGHVGP